MRSRWAFVFAGTLVVAAVGLTSCDGEGKFGKAVKVTSCALTDSQLSLVLRSPSKAIEYLSELEGRLRARDKGAPDEAADLIHHGARLVRECVKG